MTRTHYFRLLLGSLLLAAGNLVVALAVAQQGRIAEIKASGSARYTEDKIVAACGLKPGDLATREDFQAAADRLAQLGPFQNVRYRFRSQGEKVTVEFQLEDAPAVPVLFDNFPWFSDEELNEALRNAVTLFDGTAPEQGVILDRMTAALQQLLAARGIKATVERSFIPAPGEGMMQRFQVSGASMKVEAVEFLDPLAAESKQLAGDARELLNKPYSRFVMEVFAVEHILPLYHERGFLRAKVGVPQARLTGNPNLPMPDKITVVVPISPGVAYRLKSVDWSGNLALGAAALNEISGLKIGEPANGLHIFRAWERVRSEYGRIGYIQMTLDAAPQFDDANAAVSYRVTIEEGPQFRMGRLIITGLSVTAERKLYAAWAIQPGDIFNAQYFEDFLENDARKKRAFGDYVVHYTKVGHLLRPNPQTRTVDVLLDFQ